MSLLPHSSALPRGSLSRWWELAVQPGRGSLGPAPTTTPVLVGTCSESLGPEGPSAAPEA